MMMEKFNEQAYKEGTVAFAKGKSIRSLIETRIAIQSNPNNEYREAQNYQESFEIGFADALLNKLRNLR